MNILNDHILVHQFQIHMGKIPYRMHTETHQFISDRSSLGLWHCKGGNINRMLFYISRKFIQ